MKEILLVGVITGLLPAIFRSLSAAVAWAAAVPGSEAALEAVPVLDGTLLAVSGGALAAFVALVYFTAIRGRRT